MTTNGLAAQERAIRGAMDAGRFQFAFCYPCSERRPFVSLKHEHGEHFWRCAECFTFIGTPRT